MEDSGEAGVEGEDSGEAGAEVEDSEDAGVVSSPGADVVVSPVSPAVVDSNSSMVLSIKAIASINFSSRSAREVLSSAVHTTDTEAVMVVDKPTISVLPGVCLTNTVS